MLGAVEGVIWLHSVSYTRFNVHRPNKYNDVSPTVSRASSVEKLEIMETGSPSSEFDVVSDTDRSICQLT
jgi:hypothetical protein